MLKYAAMNGAERIILGLGGSATNDCGIGMAAALGYRFYDVGGKELESLAKNMTGIAHIERPESLPDIRAVSYTHLDVYKRQFWRFWPLMRASGMVISPTTPSRLLSLTYFAKYWPTSYAPASFGVTI